MGEFEKNKENTWFVHAYDKYEPDRITTDSMMSLPSNQQILIFGGMWCSDTKELLPKFFKMSDQVNISRGDVTVYFVDEQKKSEQGLEKKYNITSVPTFIVLKDGEEKGRIVETVKTSIEKDLLRLMR